MSPMRVRPGRPADGDAVAAVCRATARAGEPLPADHPAPWLVSAVYAEPYLALEPQTARLLLDGEAVVGYVVGAVDSEAFYRRWTREWTPSLVEKAAGVDGCDEVEELLARLTRPRRMLPAGVMDHPSHLHINLLPAARGGGWGAAVLDAFLAGLAVAGSPGVHLVVDPGNRRAVAFYARSGFVPVDTQAQVWVRRLTPGA